MVGGDLMSTLGIKCNLPGGGLCRGTIASRWPHPAAHGIPRWRSPAGTLAETAAAMARSLATQGE